MNADKIEVAPRYVQKKAEAVLPESEPAAPRIKLIYIVGVLIVLVILILIYLVMFPEEPAVKASPVNAPPATPPPNTPVPSPARVSKEELQGILQESKTASQHDDLTEVVVDEQNDAAEPATKPTDQNYSSIEQADAPDFDTTDIVESADAHFDEIQPPQDKKCIAINANGKQCKNTARTGEHCSRHGPSKAQ